MTIGRPKGSLGSKTLDAIGILREKGCEPLGILADVAMGSYIKCRIGLNTAGDDFTEMEVLPTLEQRLTAAKELCQYIYPKRKAVEHSGVDGEAILVDGKIEIVHVKP